MRLPDAAAEVVGREYTIGRGFLPRYRSRLTSNTNLLYEPPMREQHDRFCSTTLTNLMRSDLDSIANGLLFLTIFVAVVPEAVRALEILPPSLFWSVRGVGSACILE